MPRDRGGAAGRGRAVLLVCLVLLAGCSALPGGDSGPPGTTLAGGSEAGGGDTVDWRPAVTATDRAEGSGDGASVVLPGLTYDELSDATALTARHREELARASYTLAVSRRAVAPDGDVATQQITAAFGSTPGRFRWTILGRDGSDDETVRLRLWANGSHLHRDVDRDGRDERYEVLNGTPAEFDDEATLGADPTQGTAVDRFLGAFAVTDVTSRRTTDGTRYLLRSETVSDPGALAAGAAPPVTNASLLARIDATGVVRRLHVEYDVRRGGGVAHRSYDLTVNRVGTTTVERPSWVNTSAGT